MNQRSEMKNLITAGIDIGAATGKAVVLSDVGILSSSILPVRSNVAKVAELVTNIALEKAGLVISDLQYVISTGYGRRSVPFANRVVTEIMCHAAGVISIMPQARTVIDIGGQDSKVVSLDDQGRVRNFVMNDKCAAGTGRFLEVMANVLGVAIDEMGTLALRSNNPCNVSDTCTVFAESEMVSLRAEGRSLEDLLAGIHKAISHRVVIMGRSMGFTSDIVFTGGVAKNVAVRRALEDEIGLRIFVPQEPQIMGALGAATLARAALAELFT